MDQNKKININPESLNISSKSRSKKKNQSRKKNTGPMPNMSPLKKKLLQKIKQHSKRNKTNLNTQVYVDEFNQSMNFLKNLSKKKIQSNPIDINIQLPQNLSQIAHNTTVPTAVQAPAPAVINTEPAQAQAPAQAQTQSQAQAQAQAQTPAPPYGILKNGKKPTYREWKNHTRKNVPTFSDFMIIILIKSNTYRHAFEHYKQI